MLAKILKFVFDWEKLLNFKFHRLTRILCIKGAISEEELYALETVHILRKFTKEREEDYLERMVENMDDYISDKDVRRVLRKILYQQGYLKEAKRKYYDYILPFIQKARWTYFLNPERLYNKNIRDKHAN